MKKNQIAHVINVAEITDSNKLSYLHIAQPVTLKSMVVAKKAAEKIADVDIFAIKHKDEQVEIPPEFKWLGNIEKYAWEFVDSLFDVLPHKSLPRIIDIIQGLFEESDAEYFIYSNLDIGVYPNFYIFVNDQINKNLDSFCINRRTLPKDFNGILIDETNFELCYLMKGDPHPGVDCFVFKREVVPLLTLNNVFIGYPPVGKVLKSQIERNSKNFQLLQYERVTFHLGNDVAWKNKLSPYWIANKHQAEALYNEPKGLISTINKYKYRLAQKWFRGRNF